MTKISTEQVTAYDPTTFEQIGHLMPQLDPGFRPDAPNSEYFDRFFAGNDERALLVARMGGLVVGTAVLNLVVEQAPEATSAYMGGFVVDTTSRGTDAAPALWRRLLHTSRQMGAKKMSFNTEATRPAAIRFYEKMGARQLEDTVGHYETLIPEVQIPDDLCRGFGFTDPVITPIQNGLVNKTFLVEDGTEKTILQRLNPSFDRGLLADSNKVAAYLAKEGWEAPVALETVDGKQEYEDAAGGIWRNLHFIESQAPTPAMLGTHKLMHRVGDMLGRWHDSIRQLDYEPEHTIPHFHDTPHFAGKLEQYRFARKFDPVIADLAGKLLATYQDLPPLPAMGEQLIHGDPQLSNILFRDSQPITYIDLDTVMRGSVLLDVGDLLRSVAEADLLAGRPLDVSKLASIADGYRSRAFPELDLGSFRRIAMLATKTIATELAMRFVIDIADGNYFSWDTTKFRNQRDNHLYRTGIQQTIISGLEAAKF